MVSEGKGGHWWQRSPQLANAYFGSKMLICGDTVAILPPISNNDKKSSKPKENHSHYDHSHKEGE
jgi:hypothetical protein